MCRSETTYISINVAIRTEKGGAPIKIWRWSTFVKLVSGRSHSTTQARCSLDSRFHEHTTVPIFVFLFDTGIYLKWVEDLTHLAAFNPVLEITVYCLDLTLYYT